MNYQAQWQAIGALLKQARAQLRDEPPSAGRGRPLPSGPLRGTLVEFDQFLEHNELELAWDALAAVADRSDARGDVWLPLARAAIRMGLQDRALRAVDKLAGPVRPRKAPPAARAAS